MKSFFFYLATISLLCISCDDGDVVVTTFGFDDVTDPRFDFCSVENNRTTVFYLESPANEIMSLELNSIYDNSTPQTNDSSVSDGMVIYRKYTSDVNADNLFCQTLPPTNLNIETELQSDRGTAVLVTRLVINPEGDDDGDGLLNRQEGINNELNFIDNDDLNGLVDTDNDGIPNFRDFDDDNDNVPTIQELARDDDGNLIKNTENEGQFLYTLASNETANLPDHLNNDDDGDGKKTYVEVLENSIEPLENTDPDGTPYFRIADDTQTTFDKDNLLDHKYTINTRTTLIINNLGLTDGNTTRVQEEFNFGEHDFSFEENEFKDQTRSTFEPEEETMTTE